MELVSVGLGITAQICGYTCLLTILLEAYSLFDDNCKQLSSFFESSLKNTLRETRLLLRTNSFGLTTIKGLYLAHYAHRAIISPLILSPKRSPLHITVVLAAMLFNLL